MNTRFPQFLAAMLCTLALIFSASGAAAAAATGDSIGTLSYAKGCTVLVNGIQQPSGYQVQAGDVIRTSAKCKAQVRLGSGYGYEGKSVVAQGDIDSGGGNGGRGGVIVIDPSTRVRLYLDGNSVVAAVLIGGVHYFPALRPGSDENPAIVDGSSSDFGPIFNNAAVGSGNFPFPSIGGGGATNRRLPVTNSSGAVIGFVITDSNGVVVAFTDASGNVLATTPANGTPLSVIFGAGAVI